MPTQTYHPSVVDRIVSRPSTYLTLGCVGSILIWFAIPGWVRWALAPTMMIASVAIPPTALATWLEGVSRTGRYDRVAHLAAILESNFPSMAGHFRALRIDSHIALGQREQAKALLSDLSAWKGSRAGRRYLATRGAWLYYSLGDADGALAWCASDWASSATGVDRCAVSAMSACPYVLKNDFAAARNALQSCPNQTDFCRAEVLLLDSVIALDLDDQPNIALQKLEQLESRDPKSANVRAVIVLVLKAMALQAMGRNVDSLAEKLNQALADTVAKGPISLPRIHLVLAIWYRKNGDLQSSRNHAQEAMGLAGDQLLAKRIKDSGIA